MTTSVYTLLKEKYILLVQLSQSNPSAISNPNPHSNILQEMIERISGESGIVQKYF